MKKKSTLLVVLLSLVCLVCAAIGLTACNPDNGDGTKTIKLGETNIGTVDENGVVCNIDGAEAGKEYVITAKVDGEVSRDVVITYTVTKVDEANGTLDITYSAEGTLKLSTLSGEVENVTIDMSVKTYPAGHIKNPLTLTYDTDTDYTINNTTVWYKITVAEEGSYEITGVDNLTVVYGPASSLSGNSLTESLTTKIFSLTANTEYYVGVTSTSDVTGTLKVADYTFGEEKEDLVLTDETPLTVENLKAGEIVLVNVATEKGKTYTVTANNEHVFIAGRQSNDPFPYTFYGSAYEDFGDVAVLRLAADEDVATVTLTLTITDGEGGGEGEGPGGPGVTPAPDDFDALELDKEYDGDYTIYKLVVETTGNYTFTIIGDSETLFDLSVGPNAETLANQGEDCINFMDSQGNYPATATVELTAGTYFVMGFSGTFTVTLAD